MEKTLKVGDIVGLGAIFGGTEDILEGMKLNAKSIYSVLKLKKAISEKFGTAQDTIMALAKTYGATPLEDGKGMQIPPEKLDEFNKDYMELMMEEVTISYDTIEISANAECKANFMEAFFDFIIITD